MQDKVSSRRAPNNLEFLSLTLLALLVIRAHRVRQTATQSRRRMSLSVWPSPTVKQWIKVPVVPHQKKLWSEVMLATVCIAAVCAGLTIAPLYVWSVVDKDAVVRKTRGDIRYELFSRVLTPLPSCMRMQLWQ